MICAVFVRELLPLCTEMLLHERVDDELFADGVARDLPDELPGPAVLSVGVSRMLHILIIIGVHLDAFPPFSVELHIKLTSS